MRQLTPVTHAPHSSSLISWPMGFSGPPSPGGWKKPSPLLPLPPLPPPPPPPRLKPPKLNPPLPVSVAGSSAAGVVSFFWPNELLFFFLLPNAD
jgi:hypothetical protein